MECNRDEATRAKALAERKMMDKDFVGAKKMIVKAQQLLKEVDDVDIPKMLTVCDVHCAAGAKVNTEIDWYGILQVPVNADDALIKKQYRKLALLLHPDKNKFGGAEAAFKLVGEANVTLTDRSKRSVHDMKRNTFRSIITRPNHQPPKRPAPARSSSTPVNLHNMHQQHQHQASNPTGPQTTFWTICPSCGMRYQYYLSILKKALRCQNCLKPFIAHDLKDQAIPSGANQRSAGVWKNAGAPQNSAGPQTNVTGQKGWSATSGVHVNIGSHHANVNTKRETDGNAGGLKNSMKNKMKSARATRNPSKASTAGLKRGRRAVFESSESSISETCSDSEAAPKMNGGGGGRRRYSSEQLLFDVPTNAGAAGRWAQQRGGVRRGDGEIFVSVEPATPARLRGGDAAAGDSPGHRQQLSPGLLDLHAFDTELIPDFQVPGMYDGAQKFGYGGGLDESDMRFTANKLMSKSTVFPDGNYLKAFAEKEKAAPVAKIKVVVRKRPLNKKEVSKKEEDIIDIEQNSLTVHETKLKVDLTEYVEKHEFVFDAVLDEDVSNDEVYRETVEPVVPAIFNRTKATCFAYGQTGSGKTYTMRPLPLKASQDILRLMHHTYRNQGFQLYVSFFEIYGGKLFDLLNDRSKLCMREDGKQKVCIVGLQEYRVSDVETIKELIEKGSATRSTGTTGANEESSRSHAILQLAIKRRVDGNDSKPPRPVGKLSFIDLAGSERGADTTDNDKQTRIEGAEINKSLLALKECIRALDNDQTHIPFRGSKLTEVLRDSFIGDSRTVMISCVSPSSGSCEHTLNTLRYADRVKSLSKGGNAKKDVSLAMPLRESSPSPLPSVVPSFSASEVMNDITERSNFGWPKQQYVKEQPALTFVERMPKVKDAVEFTSSNGAYSREQRSKGFMAPNIVEVPDIMYQQGRQPARKAKDTTLGNNIRNSIAYPTRRVEPDEDEHLNNLLQEEEDLVSAHRKQVEETLDILKEEMNILGEVDQPGFQLDDYLARLNTILSQKAARIVDLQARLEQFQRLLNENNVLLYDQSP